MSTKLLLADLIQLQSELVEQRRSVNWTLQRKILVTTLKTYLVQFEYLSARSKHGVHTEFSEEDRDNIKEASAVNKQIGKHLSTLKKLK
jgi:hypothetical protein